MRISGASGIKLSAAAIGAGREACRACVEEVRRSARVESACVWAGEGEEDEEAPGEFDSIVVAVVLVCVFAAANAVLTFVLGEYTLPEVLGVAVMLLLLLTLETIGLRATLLVLGTLLRRVPLLALLIVLLPPPRGDTMFPADIFKEEWCAVVVVVVEADGLVEDALSDLGDIIIIEEGVGTDPETPGGSCCRL